MAADRRNRRTLSWGLIGFDGLWCVPGGPYASMQGALQAIQFARTQHVPFLGTCAGFQHTLIEYARNVMGLGNAGHETLPKGKQCLISEPECSFERDQLEITVHENTLLRTIYGCPSALEACYSDFDLIWMQEVIVGDGQLCVSARDFAGRVHAVELAGHPWFLATLFQPERAALRGEVHPIIRAFVSRLASARHALEKC